METQSCLIGIIIVHQFLLPGDPHLNIYFLYFVFGLAGSENEIIAVAQGTRQLFLVKSTVLNILIWKIIRQPKIIIIIFIVMFLRILPELLSRFDLEVFGCFRLDVNRVGRILMKARH